MSVGATLTASLLAVLERPATWAFALAGFLVRGGWLLVLAPIVVLPTAVGIGNVVAPLLEDVAFGRRTDQVFTAMGLGLAVIAAWLVGGGLVAAATEVETVRRTAETMDARSRRQHLGPGVTWRVLAARLVALVPLVAAVAWAGLRFVGLGYRELTNPSDVSTPAAWRIVAGAPDAAFFLLAAWLFAEIVGAVAARRIVLDGEDIRHALREGLGTLRRRSVDRVTLAGISALVLLAVVAITGLATGTAWGGLRSALAEGDASIGTTVLLVLFIGLFAAGLALIGLTSAWRSALWTVDALARDQAGDGTFGGGIKTRPGD